MISFTAKPQSMPIAPGRLTSVKYVPPHRRYRNGCSCLEATSSTSIPRDWSYKAWGLPVLQTSSSSTGSRFKEYYAGPAFLASPPASALPIPKWFRKPINEGKELSGETTLKTAAKQSPDSSDESPTLRKSGMDANQSPLQDDHPPELGLAADRAEKGKNDEENAMPTSVDEVSVISKSLNSSASPDTDQSHHHCHQNSQSRVDEEDPRMARFLALTKLLPKSIVQRDQSKRVYPPINTRPLSYGQRAVLMENYLSSGRNFESRPCITSSQFLRDLNSTFRTEDDRAKLLNEYIRRPCQCKSATCARLTVSGVSKT